MAEGTREYVLLHSGDDVQLLEEKHLEQRFKKADLDGFLVRVYNYYRGKGFLCVLLAQIFNIGLVLWVSLVVAFALSFVNYSKLFSEDNVEDAIRIRFPLNPIFWIFVIVMGAFILWQIARFVVSIPALVEVRDFYHRRLHISDEQIQTMRWVDVVKEIIRADLNVKKSLTELDVAHAIMRRENYFIAMVNKKVVPLTVHLPVLGECVLLSRMLEFWLFRIVFEVMFNKGEKQLRVEAIEARSNEMHRRRLVRELQRQFRFWGIFLAVCSPFIFLFVLAYTVIRFGEEVKSSPSALSARQWSLLARWRFREFNELPHFFQQRLGLAFKPSEEYVEQFPSHVLATVARFILFLAGSVLVVVLVLSFLDPDLLVQTELFGRTGVWYIGVCGVVVAACRALIPDANCVFQPEAIMGRVATHTHYMPRAWIDLCHDYSVYNDFDILFEYRALAFLREIASVAVAPFILIVYMPSFAADIVSFFLACTDVAGEDVEEGVGHVCSFANFSFMKHGSAEYGAPRSAGVGQSLHGKMEQSFVNFKAAYPGWSVPKDGEQLLLELSSFLRHHPYLVRPRARRDTAAAHMTRSGAAAASSSAYVHPEDRPIHETDLLLELDPADLSLVHMTYSVASDGGSVSSVHSRGGGTTHMAAHGDGHGDGEVDGDVEADVEGERGRDARV